MRKGDCELFSVSEGTLALRANGEGQGHCVEEQGTFLNAGGLSTGAEDAEMEVRMDTGCRYYRPAFSRPRHRRFERNVPVISVLYIACPLFVALFIHWSVLRQQYRVSV